MIIYTRDKIILNISPYIGLQRQYFSSDVILTRYMVDCNIGIVGMYHRTIQKRHSAWWPISGGVVLKL